MTVWIVGNGPSLSDEQLAQAENLVVVNRFHLHPLYDSLPITHHIIVDLEWGKPDKRAEVLALMERTKARMVFYDELPFSGGVRVRVHDGIEPLHHDISRPLPSPAWSTIIDVGFPLALSLGATRIVVAGVDFDYTDGHFYGPMSGGVWPGTYEDCMTRARKGTRAWADYARAQGVTVEFLGGFKYEADGSHIHP